MANPVQRLTITADFEPLVGQLLILRTLCSEVATALDTAIRDLTESDIERVERAPRPLPVDEDGNPTRTDDLATGGIVSKEGAEALGRSIGQYGCVIRPGTQSDGGIADGKLEP